MGSGWAFARVRARRRLVVGSSRDWVLRENLFGRFTDELANRARGPVVLVHRPEPTPLRAWRQLTGRLRRGGHARPRHARSSRARDARIAADTED